jgi:hypothetical protein
MTAVNDFDRVLGEWLDEGPNRAPDRPVELAMEHARSHPRRRDPLGFLRPDPMAPRSRGLGMGLRPGLVLAVLGLLLAAVAIGVGGSRQPSVVAPETSPTASPSASPTPFASPTGPASAGILVELVVAAGQPQTVDVVDESGKLLEATSGSPSGDGQSFPSDGVEVTNIDATTLQLGWAGFPCRTDHDLRIGTDPLVMTLVRPPCEGVTDSIGVDRILILRFSEPIVAADVTITLDQR